MRLAITLALILTAAVASAADPVTVPEGQPADLRVEVPAGASVVWRLYPAPTWKAKDLPTGRMIFAGRPGEKVTATALVIDFKAQTVTDVEYDVTFAGKAPPSPGPNPPPQPKPDGELGLRKVSRNGAGQVQAAARAEAKALAAANRATASAVAAGAANKGGLLDPAAALDLWRAGNKAAVANPAAWSPWATAASGGLAAAFKSGKLPATTAAWAGAFTELAEGLED